jgi:hypothetical protein
METDADFGQSRVRKPERRIEDAEGNQPQIGGKPDEGRMKKAAVQPKDTGGNGAAG